MNTPTFKKDDIFLRETNAKGCCIVSTFSEYICLVA